MKTTLSVSLLALAAALAVLPATGATRVGVNAAVRNKVQMKTDADADLRPAIVREDVHLGDLVSSGEQSSLQMLLLDHSVFTVGANARMKIDRFVYDPNKGTTDIAASVTKGAFRFLSGQLLPGAGRQAIRTPVATIGVRGTIVEGAVGQDAVDVVTGEPGVPAFTGDPTNAVLILLRGPSGTQGAEKQGAIDVEGANATTTMNKPGNALVYFPGRPVIGPFVLSDAAYARFASLLNPTPHAGGSGGPDIGSAGAASGDNSVLGDFGNIGGDIPSLDLPVNPPPLPPPPPCDELRCQTHDIFNGQASKGHRAETKVRPHFH